MDIQPITLDQLTSTLFSRQLFDREHDLSPEKMVQHLVGVQAQYSPAPYIALAARCLHFAHADLEKAIHSEEVFKTTTMRGTLHLVHSDEHLVQWTLARLAWLNAFSRKYPHVNQSGLKESLREFLQKPRRPADIRAHNTKYMKVAVESWGGLHIARTLLPLRQIAPAGYWREFSRPQFILDNRPLPAPDDAAAQVVAAYLRAYGPASLADMAAFFGTAQKHCIPAVEKLDTVQYQADGKRLLYDMQTENIDLRAREDLPVRLLAHWDQPLLAYKDRQRILPDDIRKNVIAINGDTAQTILLDGRVAGTWTTQRTGLAVAVNATLFSSVKKTQRSNIIAECQRMGLVWHAGAYNVNVTLKTA